MASLAIIIKRQEGQGPRGQETLPGRGLVGSLRHHRRHHGALMHGLILDPDARKPTQRGMAAIGGADQRHGQGLAIKKGELRANA